METRVNPGSNAGLITLNILKLCMHVVQPMAATPNATQS
jgi:hypothetical protein